MNVVAYKTAKQRLHNEKTDVTTRQRLHNEKTVFISAKQRLHNKKTDATARQRLHNENCYKKAFFMEHVAFAHLKIWV